MTEPAEKIIVFDSFDNVIKANIIKTKLDAYGIPCFLTGEHFVNVYPIRNELFPGVRLCIFEKDLERVREILVEEPIPESDILRCPRCGSKNVVFEEGKKSQSRSFLFFVMFFLILFPLTARKKVYWCKNCENEFNP